jgi:5-methylcytosine-specific restriction enzyme subunit McrC
MDGLRTVTVLEHEVISVIGTDDVPHDGAGTSGARTWLTAAEAKQLLRLNDLRRGFCQTVSGGVKLAQYCGIVRLGTCVLEVLPKIGMAEALGYAELERSRGALLTMLHSAREIAITKLASVPQQAVRAPLLDVFIETFLDCALEQARRGLLSRYVPHSDDLPVMKGRFHAHGHARHNIVRPHLFRCEYDDFTADNAYNRAIRATLDACLAWITQTSTRRLWFEIRARYASVSPVRMKAADVVRLPRDRTTHRYEPVLTWCEWLLSILSPAISAGVTSAPGLLFDMNKLFEAYVSRLQEREAGDAYIVLRQGPELALATSDGENAFMLRPDVSVWRPGPVESAPHIVRVVDAKWKRLDPDGTNWHIDQGDIYQMVAYALRYNCQQVELVYPALSLDSDENVPLPVFVVANPTVERESIQIRIRTVPLWQ